VRISDFSLFYVVLFFPNILQKEKRKREREIRRKRSQIDEYHDLLRMVFIFFVSVNKLLVVFDALLHMFSAANMKMGRDIRNKEKWTLQNTMCSIESKR
jgi:hypothetical protein